MPLRRQQIREVQFDGDQLVAVVLDGEGVAVPVRDYCEALGLDVDRQSERIREHEVISAGLHVLRIPYRGRVRSIVTILHKVVPFWLATITPSLVKPEVRPKLITYQTEVADLLATVYTGTFGGITVPTGDAATTELAQQLSEAIIEVRLARDALLEAHQQTLAEQQRFATDLKQIAGEVADLKDYISHRTTITGPQQEFLLRGITAP